MLVSKSPRYMNDLPYSHSESYIYCQTKKKRPSRRAPVKDEEPTVDQMDIDEKPISRVRDLDANFVDDDELQAALARSRRAKLSSRKKLTPEQLAQKSKTSSACVSKKMLVNLKK